MVAFQPHQFHLRCSANAAKHLDCNGTPLEVEDRVRPTFRQAKKTHKFDPFSSSRASACGSHDYQDSYKTRWAGLRWCNSHTRCLLRRGFDGPGYRRNGKWWYYGRRHDWNEWAVRYGRQNRRRHGRLGSRRCQQCSELEHWRICCAWRIRGNRRRKRHGRSEGFRRRKRDRRSHANGWQLPNG